MKKTIRLNERELHRLISESVKRVLNENEKRRRRRPGTFSKSGYHVFPIKELRIQCAGRYENLSNDFYKAHGYSPNDDIVYRGRTTRWRGTGYYDSWYEHIKTGDAIVVRHNDGTVHFNDLTDDSIDVYPEHYNDQREYGRKMSMIAKEYGLPFRLVCMYDGDCDKIAELIDCCHEYSKNFEISEDYFAFIHNLTRCGIDRRNSAINKVLPEHLIPVRLGQRYSQTLANTIAGYLLKPNVDAETEKLIQKDRKLRDKREMYDSFGLGYDEVDY